MIALIAVRRMAANISSAAAWSELWMISVVIGSNCFSCFAMIVPLLAGLDVEVAVVVHAAGHAGVDHGGAARLLDHGRPAELHAGLQQLPVVDHRLVDPRGEVHLAFLLDRLPHLAARDRQAGWGEPA